MLMLIKMAIIGAILLGGGVVFANEINQFLPETSVNFLDSVKNDFGKTKDGTVQSAETRVEGTIVTLTNEVNNIQEKSSELLSKSAKEVIDSTQKGIKEITKTTQKTIFGGNGNNQNTNSNEEHEDGNSSPSPDNGSTVTQTDDENTISLETSSLKTTQQSDDGIMLQYEDTSGKTISVSVTLRTTERELFSGIFYSSMFETL
ncbi:MAG: conserved hypothetical exported protein, partial [Marine Group I thaumarchaeote]